MKLVARIVLATSMGAVIVISIVFTLNQLKDNERHWENYKREMRDAEAPDY